MRNKVLLAALGLTAWIGLPGNAAEARSCDAVAGDVAAASSKLDTDRMIGLYKESEQAAPACSDRYRVCLGRSVAHAFVDRAYSAFDQNRPLTELEAMLAEAKQWALTWKVLLAEAELAEQQKRYDAAAAYYQAALNDLSEPGPCPGEEAGIPDAAGLRGIFKRASLAGLLSKDFVEPPRDRNNEPGGLFLPSVRGIAPAERALPVEFEYDSTAFTRKGTKAAEALAGYIARNAHKFSVLRLSGHTDERGSQSYNCGLSAARLTAIVDYLYTHGVSSELQVELVPQGEAQPIHLDDPTRYSAEEIYQVNRRVVLFEDDAPITRACR